MPKPRFFRMAPDDKATLLNAALATFAASGFRDASLNALLRSLTMSKGAFYHAFADKADLYAAVVTHIVEAFPPPALPSAIDSPDVFWATVSSHVTDVYAFVASDAEREAFARDLARLYATGQVPAPVQKRIAGLDETILRYVRAGRACGAVRNDVPELLVAQMLLAAGAALDVWVAANLTDMQAAQTLLLPALDMMRRMVAPPDPA